MSEVANYDIGSLIGTLVTAVTLIATVVVGVEKFLTWVVKRFNMLYKRKRGKEIQDAQVDNHTQEIKKLADNINNLIAVTNEQYVALNNKIDEQNYRLNVIDEEGKKRDCAVLRDRILGGIRYFSQNKDENGVVHISLTDYENMHEMFHEYFNAGGNGAVKHIYETDFTNFKIDSSTLK